MEEVRNIDPAVGLSTKAISFHYILKLQNVKWISLSFE